MLSGVTLLALLASCTDAPPVDTVCGLHGCEEVDLGDGGDGKADGENVHLEWGTSIVVVGAPEASRAVIADLDAMTATGVGHAALAAVEDRALVLGGRVMVRARPEPSSDPLSCANTVFVSGLGAAQVRGYTEDETGKVVITEPGVPLQPTAIRVLYNRECHIVDADGTSCDAPMVLLMHELLHVSHALRGEITNAIRDNTDPMPGGSNHEEARTIGRGAYRGEPLNENALRDELALPIRTSHGSLCGVVP